MPPGRPAYLLARSWPLRLLVEQRPYPGDVAPDVRQLRVIGELLGGLLHAQPELLAQQRLQLGAELFGRLRVQIFSAFRGFHRVSSLAAEQSMHEYRLDRQLGGGECERLPGERLVGENADPDSAAPLDVARHRPARGLDLAGREPAAGGGLQAVLAEAHLGANGRNALVAAFLLLAVLPSSWLQHSSLPRSCARASAPPAPVPAPPAARRCAASLHP